VTRSPHRTDRRERIIALRGVVSRWVEFQTALSDKRKYRLQRFESFADVTRRYVQATRGDALIHRRVVEAINGLTDFPTAERKHAPQDVL
jgi:predicted nucleic acid-binding OB-fold protein